MNNMQILAIMAAIIHAGRQSVMPSEAPWLDTKEERDQCVSIAKGLLERCKP